MSTVQSMYSTLYDKVKGMATAAKAPADPYASYYNKAMQQIQPYMNRGLEDTKAGLVDQGLLSSTAGQGKLGDVRGMYLAQAAQLAQNQSNADRSFAENQRQYNATQAARIYELLMSGALGRATFQQNTKGVRFPNDPASFKVFSKFRGDPLEQTGDPREQWARHSEDWGTGFAQRQDDRIASDAAAGRALEKARIDLQRDMFEAEQGKEGDDPWKSLSNMVMANRISDTDPNTPGMQLALYPTDLIQKAQTDYSLDLVSIAKDETHPDNDKALALLKMMYPGGGWAKLLGMGSTAEATPFRPVSHSQAAPGGFLSSPGYAALTGVGGAAGGALRSAVEGIGSNPSVRSFFGQAPGRTELPGPETWWSRVFGAR